MTGGCCAVSPGGGAGGGVEGTRGAPPEGRWVGGGAREAPVEVGDEGRQIGVGGLEGRDPSEPQFADEAVLQGLPQPLDAALGLRGVGLDVADPELLQDAPEVGGVLGAVQLFLERPVAVVAGRVLGRGAASRRGGAVGLDARAEIVAWVGEY